jgi:Ca2+/H+ antiporter, TMEM165/GDT1 family
MDWVHTGTAVSAAFLASLVEFVEALTIVLAVGAIRGWRSALIGVGVGVGFLTLLVILFGHALERAPLHASIAYRRAPTALLECAGFGRLFFGRRT